MFSNSIYRQSISTFDQVSLFCDFIIYPKYRDSNKTIKNGKSRDYKEVIHFSMKNYPYSMNKLFSHF